MWRRGRSRPRRQLSNGKIGVVTILHERIHQIERFREDFGLERRARQTERAAVRHHASQAVLGAAAAVVLGTWPSLRLGGWAMTFVSKRVGMSERQGAGGPKAAMQSG